jgi:NAD(P)-dependent dehydrogenase (short-subunit alcohol dehydrogenase family)
MKGGLTTLTSYMAKEFSRRGIRVNSVAPGATRARIGDDAYDRYPEAIKQIAGMTALGRLCEADDVGDAIAALLSDDFRWETGQHIEASGGPGCLQRADAKEARSLKTSGVASGYLLTTL